MENALSASGIRPRKMLEAFRSLGYVVDVVSGYSQERRGCIETVKRNVKNGIKYDFAYGEDTTLPFAMNDPSHIPFSPLMDYAFWAWMKRNNIPFGCFYRDMYWRFPEYRKGLSFHKWAAPLPFHYLDIYMLRKLCKCVFFPTVECADDLPIKIPRSMVKALPPGCDYINIIKNSCTDWDVQHPLRLFYVGGILPPSYNIAPIINFIISTELPIEFIICCRKKEFDRVIAESIYKNINSSKITVIHKSGKELEPYWEKADIFVVLWENVRYLKNTMPFKVSEAIGHALPIIISNGSAAARMVAVNDFGWTIEPTYDNIKKLITFIINNPQQLSNKVSILYTKRSSFTWQAMAQHVAQLLLS